MAFLTNPTKRPRLRKTTKHTRWKGLLKLSIKLIIQTLQELYKVLIGNQLSEKLILNRALLHFATLSPLLLQLFKIGLDNLLPERDGTDDQGCDEGGASGDTTTDGEAFVFLGPHLRLFDSSGDTFYRDFSGTIGRIGKGGVLGSGLVATAGGGGAGGASVAGGASAAGATSQFISYIQGVYRRAFPPISALLREKKSLCRREGGVKKVGRWKRAGGHIL